LSPDGTGTLVNQRRAQQSFLPELKEKVALRTAWFLPFLYGMLGSAIFAMRQAASIRVPTSAPTTTFMRICFGGIAGVAMSWFTLPKEFSTFSESVLPLPFALAFISGYGIEVFFRTIDSVNRLIIGHSTRTESAAKA